MGAQPALVYARAESRVDIDRYLRDHGLYRWDDITESSGDFRLPPDQRPVLRRLLWLCQIAAARAELGGAEVAQVVIIDRVESLGDGVAAQVGVVGAMFDFDFKVVAGYKELPQRWYFEHLERIERASVDELTERMEESDTFPATLAAHRPELLEDLTWFLPTSLSRGTTETLARVQTLMGPLGLGATQAAQQLSVEGYRNLSGRVRWYTKAARDAFEESQ